MPIDETRFYKNDFDDATDPTNWETRLAEAISAAESQLRCARHSKPSIYSGECGALFAMLRVLPPEDSADSPETLSFLQRRLEAIESDFHHGRVTFLEGLPGNLALQIAVHRRLGSHSGEEEALIRRLHLLAEQVCSLDKGECEVLYGRCGFLGTILFLRRDMGNPRLLQETAIRIIADVLTAGRKAAQTRDKWPLYYEWHGKCYFGGAHGLAGILFTLLQFPEELERFPDAAQLVRATADVLLSRRFKSNNMPSSEGSYKDCLVHWCHGATGFVPLLLRLARVYREPQYRELAASMGEVIWARGLLRSKGPGLCHGIPGNGYALLALHAESPTGEEAARWLRRARHFAVFAADHASELTLLADRPHSMFEGLAGALAFWHDVAAAPDRPLESARFPGYEF